MKITSFNGYNDESGQHPTELCFAVSGRRGAVVWRLNTGLAPAGHWPSRFADGLLLYKCNVSYPSTMGVTAHSELDENTVHAENYDMSEECEFLDGRACVCTYSRHLTSDFTSTFACEGIPGVERLLTEIYTEHYGESPDA